MARDLCGKHGGRHEQAAIRRIAVTALVALAGAAGSGAAWAGDPGMGDPMNPLIVDGMNGTQVSMANAVLAVCPGPVSAGNTEDFQNRCDGVATATSSSRLDGFQTASPEQIASPNNQGTRAGGGDSQATTTVSTRIAAFRAGAIAAIELEFNGERANGTSLADLRPAGLSGGDRGLTLGAAGSDVAPRFGVYLNGGYQFGEIDSTFALRGFDFDNGGLTAGGDYRLTDSVLLGAAFNWWRTEARFQGDGGKTQSDLYGGSLYATWLPTNGLYLSSVASLAGVEYDARRKIQYTTTPNPMIPGSTSDTVDTVAKGTPKGSLLTVAGMAGYDFKLDFANIGPYAQVQYRRIVVDQYEEEGGDGWGMLFLGQNIQSVTTALGANIDVPVSTGLGVVVTQIRGAWWHEYMDDARAIRAQYLGARANPNNREFEVFTDKPDRNYGNVGVAVSLTLPAGVAGFVDYDALLGYDGLSSHRFTLGARMSF